jgi:hypothetical protein
VALHAPPVPTKPVIRPEIAPPVIIVVVLVGNLSSGLCKNKIDIIIKNIPRITFKLSCDNSPTIKAPIKLRTMLGMPKVIIILLSRPCLKKLILPRFPNKCDIATSISAVLKSTKIKASGRNIVEEPKPATAPIISDTNVVTKNTKAIVGSSSKVLLAAESY